MENYYKWKKLVFETAVKSINSVSRLDKTEEGSFHWSFDDVFHGILTLNPDTYEKHMEKFLWNSIFSAESVYSSTFRTANIHNSTKYSKELFLCRVQMISPRYTYKDHFILTPEGIVCHAQETSKKFVFFGSTQDPSWAFATYRELATEGFKVDDRYVTLSSNIDYRYLLNNWVKKTIKMPFTIKFIKKLLPAMAKLYKENEDLYDDAIDEFVEKYKDLV